MAINKFIIQCCTEVEERTPMFNGNKGYWQYNMTYFMVTTKQKQRGTSKEYSWLMHYYETLWKNYYQDFRR